jgi:hypothetical protein
LIILHELRFWFSKQSNDTNILRDVVDINERLVVLYDYVVSDFFFTETHSLYGARPKILQEEISFIDELLQYFLASISFQILRERFLVAIAGVKGWRNIIVSFAQIPQLLTVDWFDLDDVGTMVTQHHGSHWPRYHTG